jgi:hypothetical protein
MKKLLLLPVFALTVLVANAQAPTTSGVERQNGPVMKFDELEFNFGTIKQGESVTHEFRFKNAGKEPLLINNAVGSCGCTVPDYPKEPIKPNTSGVIKVTFNSAGKSGPQDKTVTITYDTDKTIVLHMKGTVEVPAAAPAQTAPAPAPATDKKDAPVVTPKSSAPAPAPKATAPAPKVVATPAPAPAPAAAEKKEAAPAAVEAKPKN